MADEIISCANAKAQGLKYYFTGKTCKAGHLSKRWCHNGVCYECSKENTKRWSKLNHSTQAEKMKIWRINNPKKDKINRRKSNAKWFSKPENKEKVRVLAAKRLFDFPERVRDQRKITRIKNADKIRERNRIWRSKNVEHLRFKKRQWRIDNIDRARAYKRNAKARRKLSQGTHSASDIREIWQAQRGRCAYCRCKLKKYHVDHIVALARGGTNFRKNVQIACETCNLAKGAKDPIDFAQSRGLLI